MSRINTNVASINTQRQIGQTNQAFNRTVGRLSTGFRINRAADDAAGLGIANQLRADIRALGQASRNATQANSLLQVAEGATSQVSGIVDRMKELAAQSASDNVNNEDRALIQSEFNELREELTRIVDTTRFQGNILLDGSFGELGDPVATGLTGGVDGVEGEINSGFTGVSDAAVSVGDASQLNAAGYDITAEVTDPGSGDVLRFTLSDGTDTDTFDVSLSSGDVSSDQTVNLSVGTLSVSFDIDETTTATTVASESVSIGVEEEAERSAQFMVSVSGGGDDFVEIGALDLSVDTLGLDAASLATRGDAESAIGTLDAAIDTISSALGDIGAAQNRLDFAAANVNTTIENFSAAESVIRDADFAEEASEFARLQILQQSQIAMLAQANAAPQGVLQLLA